MKKVNPFVIVFVVVLAVIGVYVYFTYIHRMPVDTQTYTEKATVLKAYYVEGQSTLEDKTYYVDLKSSRGDKMTAEGTVYYSVCKNKVGSQVSITYQVVTYNDGTKKIIIQDIAGVNSGHKDK